MQLMADTMEHRGPDDAGAWVDEENNFVDGWEIVFYDDVEDKIERISVKER